jgi:hypothetical protein
MRGAGGLWSVLCGAVGHRHGRTRYKAVPDGSVHPFRHRLPPQLPPSTHGADLGSVVTTLNQSTHHSLTFDHRCMTHSGSGVGMGLGTALNECR